MSIPLDCRIKAGRQRILENERLAQEKRDAEALKKAIILTSGYSVEGYRIVEYRDFISSEAALGLGAIKAILGGFADFFGTESEALTTKLQEGREVVKERIKNKAFALKCNAIIGLDIDITMFGESILGIYANGTAVVIEPIE
ncbi:MAG: YbjQ family protein [Coriobacteriia bacterium]|nr:YbjQ family protein [Coriobacteriia bacterium]